MNPEGSGIPPNWLVVLLDPISLHIKPLGPSERVKERRIIGVVKFSIYVFFWCQKGVPEFPPDRFRVLQEPCLSSILQ